LRDAAAGKKTRNELVPAEGKGQATVPRVGPPAGEAPVETAPPNVPEFKPAFPGQTRAPAIHTRTAFEVTELAGDFDQPWALAFLPDGRLLVTEKQDGELFILSADGKEKSPPVEAVPRVDGRGQGGLLDVEVAPDYATTSLIYLSYYEPRQGGNGLAVARGRLVARGRPRFQDPKVIFHMEPTLASTKTYRESPHGHLRRGQSLRELLRCRSMALVHRRHARASCARADPPRALRMDCARKSIRVGG
jgi:glucose/arabinose dehydrogenase